MPPESPAAVDQRNWGARQLCARRTLIGPETAGLGRDVATSRSCSISGIALYERLAVVRPAAGFASFHAVERQSARQSEPIPARRAGSRSKFGEMLQPILREVGIVDPPELYPAEVFVSA
jgi:hypothetical protein